MKKTYFAPSVCTVEMETDTLLAGSGIYDGTTIFDDEHTTSQDNITYGEAKRHSSIWDED